MENWILFIFGISIGSFLNVLIDRLPKGKTLWGRSHCDWCKKTLRWHELVPVLSWIFQLGHCRRCHKPLSIQYPLIEITTGLGFMYFYPDPIAMILFCILLVIFVADLKYQIIPDSMVVVGLIASIGSLRDNFLSGIGAALFFYALWRITKGRGMGFGDVKLAGLLGIILGFPNIIIALYSAFLTGATAGVILILRGVAGLKSKIAFGPFLIIGAAIALVWGNKIIVWWKGVI